MPDEHDANFDVWDGSAFLPPLGRADGALAGVLRVLLGQPSWAVVVESVAAVGIVGLLDYVTGPESAFPIFYIAPVVLVSWAVSWRAGLGISVLSSATWFAHDAIGDRETSNLLVMVGPAMVRFAFFVLTAALVHGARHGIARERVLARTDPLTGVANTRSFEDRLEFALAYLRRTGSPLTVAYVDLDDFKAVNDRFGHSEGDSVLRTVASAIQGRLRHTDLVARIGGDEFAIVLPDTDEDTALAVLSEIEAAVAEEIGDRWLVRETIGAMTFTTPPESIDTMVRSADGLMYLGKYQGKARIIHATWPGPQADDDREQGSTMDRNARR